MSSRMLSTKTGGSITMVRHLPVYIIDHVAATTKTDLKSLRIQCRRGPHPVIYNRRNYLGSEPEDYKGSVKVGRLHCNRFDIRSLPVSVRDGLLGGLMTGFDIRGCNATILKGCFPHLDLPYLEMYLRDRARVCPPDVPLAVGVQDSCPGIADFSSSRDVGTGGRGG